MKECERDARGVILSASPAGVVPVPVLTVDTLGAG